MPVEVPPSRLLDNGQTLRSLLGSFWASYGDSAGIGAYCQGLDATWLQSEQDADEMADCVGRFTVPVWHRELGSPLTLVRSQQLPDQRLLYGANDDLGPSTATLGSRTFDWALPTGLHGCGWLADALTAPTVFWGRDVGFTIDREMGAIRFQQDPFVVMPSQRITTAGVPDQQLTLWMGQADFDRGYIAQQFGSVLKLVFPSSPNYRSLVNAVWTTGLLGTSRASLDQALSAACDAPVSQVDGEVVMGIVAEPERLLFLTSAAVYRAGPAANPVVTVGQVLPVGTALTDAFQVIELSQGTPSSEALGSLTLPMTWLEGAFSGPLTWDNALTPLQVTQVDGRTFVSWALGGATEDVALFFTAAQNYAIAHDVKTLAQLLDTRPVDQQTGDPDVNSLPTQINPMDFLVTNVLRYGTTWISLKTASFGPDALGTAVLGQVLRELIPPQGGTLLVVDCE